MNEIVIVFDGYSDGNKADCTVTLVKSPDLGVILVDTSSPWNSNALLHQLLKLKIQPQDINIVIGTHGHVDHIGNLNLFPKAKFFVGFDICTGNVYEDFDFTENPLYKLSKTIDVLATPGHTCSDISLIVQNTCLGTVVIAGDLFENKNDQTNEIEWTSKSFNIDQQRQNRDKVLKIANYIVPGHGKMFKNDKFM